MVARGRTAWLSAIFVLGLSATALAEPDASKSFDQGLALYRRHEYSKAAEAFFAAYKASPTADAIYNAGLAWELAGDAPIAATAYELAGTLGLSADAGDDAQSRLERLAPSLGRIEVSVPEKATVHSKPFALEAAKAVLYFYPGRHRVRVTLRNGTEIIKAVMATAGETTVLLVESSSSSDEDAPDEETDQSAPAQPPKDRASPTPWSTIGWVSLGVAGAAAVGAVYFGLETLSARDDFNASNHRDAGARDRAERNMHITNICWATTVIAGAGGVGVLLFAPPDEHKAAAFAPRVVVRGTF